MSKKRTNKSIEKLDFKQLIAGLIIFGIIFLVEYLIGVSEGQTSDINNKKEIFGNTTYSNIVEIPDYSGEICVKINDNKPYFTEEDYTTKAFEKYSELDSLGRCGVAYANICKETRPPKGDERGDISSVHPTGWKQAKFNGEYLYNRCHLIAYCLSDEDANKQNLITGTRYFNTEGMLPIETLVLEYLNKNQDNHILYRVTPVFKGENLLATGVEMEAYSVEDNGELSFNVFVYNVQPGVNLNYATGELINK